jgi:hypothetical protein
MRIDHGTVSRGRGRRWGWRVLYWLAVMAVSIALVVAVLMLLQSFDGSTIGVVAIGRE